VSRAETVKGALAKRQRTIYQLIESQKGQIARALPRHLDPDRLARVAYTVIRQSPQLAEASSQSLLGALMTCAQLGLEPGGPMGQAWLIPRKNKHTKQVEATFQIGYRGYIELARRSGLVRTIVGRVVRQGDLFEYDYGIEERLVHRPQPGSEGEVTFAYAVVRYTDGYTDFEVLSRAEIEKVRRRSVAADDGPWVTDYAEMAKKSAIRRLAKRLPLSIEFAQAVAQEERVRTSIDPADLDVTPDPDDGVIDVEPEPEADQAEQVAAK
jgi:recombination protein RecT